MRVVILDTEEYYGDVGYVIFDTTTKSIADERQISIKEIFSKVAMSLTKSGKFFKVDCPSIENSLKVLPYVP